MAQYSLFVLKVPLNTNQPTNQSRGADNMHSVESETTERRLSPAVIINCHMSALVEASYTRFNTKHDAKSAACKIHVQRAYGRSEK